MMQVPAIGAFVRALLPVRLSGGHTITFGVWVGINPQELQRVFAVCWTCNTGICDWTLPFPTRSRRGACWQPRSPRLMFSGAVHSFWADARSLPPLWPATPN